MASYGRYTQIDLGDLTFLPQADGEAPQLNREAARFALELAAVAYNFDVDRWLNADWTDISIQADERVLTGVRAPESEPAPLRQRILNEYLEVSARRYIASNHIIRRVSGRALRRSKEQETGKAITMIHPLPAGRYAVAVGFMGTGRRASDWAVNFRLRHPDGFHEGFALLCRQFMENADKILFERTATRLGLPRLSLQDIILEAGQGNNRFKFLVAGHSQGAAVMQLWVHELIKQGVPPEDILGYGFGSPSVAAGPAQYAQDYPLFHFINSEDLFARVGLLHHFGHCYVYQADAPMRDLCYQGMQISPLFMSMLATANSFGGTHDALRFNIAYIEALKLLPPREAAAALAVFTGTGLKERLLLSRDEPVGGLLRLMGRSARRFYERAGVAAIEETELTDLIAHTAEQIEINGAETYTRMFLRVLSIPHALILRDEGSPGLAPYSYMVIRAIAQMREVRLGDGG
jgi:hypothetical protein